MNRKRNPFDVFEGGLGFLAALGAYRLVIGSAADPTSWRSVMEYYGNPQDISWGFPLAAAATQLVLAGLAWHLLALKRTSPDFFSIAAIGRAGLVGLLLLPVLLGLFAALRPPNFSVALVFLSLGLAFAASMTIRLAGLAILAAKGGRSLVAEAQAAPRTVNVLLVLGGSWSD
jgi:hypothetical protein